MMATYASGIVPFLNVLIRLENEAQMVAFADDLTGTGTLQQLKLWYSRLVESDPICGPSETCKMSPHCEKRNCEVDVWWNRAFSYVVNVIFGAIVSGVDYKDQYVCPSQNCCQRSPRLQLKQPIQSTPTVTKEDLQIL